MSWWYFLLTAVLLHFHPAAAGKLQKPNTTPASLSPDYYKGWCPKLSVIIHKKVRAWVQKDYTLAAALIRLHFHDCVVRGCDGSVLLKYPGSERSAPANRNLRGFNVINDIKQEVEKHCPNNVSCADILTAAARDATLLMGGPFWPVPFGRKDGRISLQKEALGVPQGYEDITSLLELFDELGLNFIDLVVLLGTHTIGRSSCHAIHRRVFNFTGDEKPDPSMNVDYMKSVRMQCPNDTNKAHVDLDVTTPRVFDNTYYLNLASKMGLLSTDQLLQSDPRTSLMVSIMATQPVLFAGQYALSMVKLGAVHVLTGTNQGEVRLNCESINGK